MLKIVSCCGIGTTAVRCSGVRMDQAVVVDVAWETSTRQEWLALRTSPMPQFSKQHQSAALSSFTWNRSIAIIAQLTDQLDSSQTMARCIYQYALVNEMSRPINPSSILNLDIETEARSGPPSRSTRESLRTNLIDCSHVSIKYALAGSERTYQ